MSEAQLPDRDLLAVRIREARKMAGLSQAQVAKLLGIHRPAVTGIESGKRQVSAGELAKMAELFDVSVSWLIGEAPEFVDENDPHIQLAARELKRLDPDDLERLLKLIAAIKSKSTYPDGG